MNYIASQYHGNVYRGFPFTWDPQVAAGDPSDPSLPAGALISASGTPERSVRAGTINVLLIEDNPGDVFVVKEVLKQCGFHFELQVNADGEEALAYLQELERNPAAPCPGLILIDLNLPRVPGIKVLGEIRRHSRCRLTPVVITTSSDSPADLAAIQQLGANAYFRKPADVTAYLELGKIIRQLLPEVEKKG